MGDLTEFLKSIKFPTLTATGIAIGFGYLLIKDSGESINLGSEVVGVLMIALGVVFLCLAFLDFRYKDSTDNLVISQTKTIKNLESLVKTMTDTNRHSEKIAKQSMTQSSDDIEIGGRNKQGFKIRDSDTTATS